MNYALWLAKLYRERDFWHWDLAPESYKLIAQLESDGHGPEARRLLQTL